jgi:hypothetical protein
VERSGKRFDEEVLTFADPDGLKLEMVGYARAKELLVPRGAMVPPGHAIRGFPSASNWKAFVSLSIAITKRVSAISATISTRGDDTKCSMRSIAGKSGRIYFSGFLPCSTGELHHAGR